MVQEGIGQSRSVHAKEEHVDDHIAGAQEGRGVLLVFLGVEETLLIGCEGDVVELAEVIVDTVGVDREVAGVVDVTVPDGENDPEGSKGAQEAVDGAEEGDHERVGRIPEQSVPIPGREGVDAKAVVEPCNSIQMQAVGGDPAHPAELGERNGNVAREPEPDKHGAEHEVEELDARHAPDTSQGSLDGCVLAGVEGRIECDSNQRSGPDTVRRVYNEAPADSSHSVTDEVRTQGNEDLIASMRGVWLVEILRQVLHPDDVVGIRRVVGNISHYGNEHMFLSVEGTWVERMPNTEQRKPFIRQPCLTGLSERISQ